MFIFNSSARVWHAIFCHSHLASYHGHLLLREPVRLVFNAPHLGVRFLL